MKIANSSRRQTGASLMEVLVAMSISLVVTAAMVALMSNTLGTTTRIIKMTKLTDDLRVAMQMMTRDVRRSNYNAWALLCYANEDCADDGSITAAGDVTIVDGSCFWFETDRSKDGDSTNDAAGGFRRRSEVRDGQEIGWIEMYTGAPGADDTVDPCDPDSGGWVEITNPENVNITVFSIDDQLSYTEIILQDLNGNVISQKVRKLRLGLRGELFRDPDIFREVEDVISIRNDLIL